MNDLSVSREERIITPIPKVASQTANVKILRKNLIGRVKKGCVKNKEKIITSLKTSRNRRHISTC